MINLDIKTIQLNSNTFSRPENDLNTARVVQSLIGYDFDEDKSK